MSGFSVWISGRIENPDVEDQYYYEPIQNRLIPLGPCHWMGKTSKPQAMDKKKVSILITTTYGGKDNIGVTLL
ncbi:MAG: hypothetical protein R2741_09490 [Methanolobus sp.]